MKSAGGPLLAIQREPTAPGAPQRQRVYCAVLSAIQAGALLPGARLPSARQLASEWRISRSAVDDAYEQLQIEGLIGRRVGDGSYVTEGASGLAGRLAAPAPPLRREPSELTMQVLRRFGPWLQPAPHLDLRPRPLRAMVPDVDSFPLDTWRRLAADALGEGVGAGRSGLYYGHPQGEEALRAATARHLTLTQAAPCRPEQVVIVNSVLQAYELIVRALLMPGDTVALEDPGFISTARLLALSHLDVVGIPLDRQGLSVNALAKLAPHAAAVFLHAFNQYPTGIVTSAVRSAELMRWAERSGAWVVDTHLMREVAHDAPPPTGLAMLDGSERTLTVGTYAAMTFPSLRLAYLVVPERLVDVFVAVRGLLGDHSPVANQTALAAYLDRGHASRRLRAVRMLYQRRRDLMQELLRRHLPRGVQLGPMTGGVNVALHWPPSLPDHEVVERLAARGVTAGSLSSHAIRAGACNGLIAGYGGYEPHAIEAAVAVLGEVLRASHR